MKLDDYRYWKYSMLAVRFDSKWWTIMIIICLNRKFPSISAIYIVKTEEFTSFMDEWKSSKCTKLKYEEIRAVYFLGKTINCFRTRSSSNYRSTCINMYTFTTNWSFNESISIKYDCALNIHLIIVGIFLENRFMAEPTIDYSDRPTTLRFANDTIDEPVNIQYLFNSFFIHFFFLATTCS
jgi:hypothetical protein